MGLYDFTVLSQDKKAKMVWNQGVYLCMRPYKNGLVNLYGIDDFYVEVFYDEAENHIEEIRSFQAVACLEPYLDRIEISL